ncbi:GLPGLI family protein [Carboxylicivirga sp. A043]|uniref:GLPGLI family protein n=1 Tax=Carboxylicivirga litoralis TaxID=2816963 RepID=UPI0021CB6764|nr:GLPGLI family protein [Carboxylicivirga sp. A043]MCU4154576.1 GLPGLI family protein [Carboxylicivirga sp. A043]
MKLFFTLSLVLLSCLANSQNKELKIAYNYINHAKPNTYMMELVANNEQVFSYTIRLTKSGAGKRATYKQTTDSTKLFKDYTNNYFVYEERLGRDYHVIEEELKLFKWNEVGQRDTILGYPCKTAFAEFRGREYQAFYTTELPFTAAPWKLHGLPGVVLRVMTTDDVLVLEAQAVDITDNSNIVYNPFSNYEAISYDDFCKHYKNYRKEVIKKRHQRAKQQNRPAPKNDKAPRIEVIIPENRFILND